MLQKTLQRADGIIYRLAVILFWCFHNDTFAIIENCFNAVLVKFRLVGEGKCSHGYSSAIGLI